MTLLEKAERSSRALKAKDRDTLGWEEATLMDKPWFDQESGTLLLDEYVVEMDSYRRIVEDETITDDELDEQIQRVTSLLRQLEETLSPEAKAIATEALGELAVLNALQVKRLQAASMLPQ
jgi:predicted ribosome quality control (RQC) complex YloA/Tae2 family protein